MDTGAGEDAEGRSANWNVEFAPRTSFVQEMWEQRADEYFNREDGEEGDEAPAAAEATT